MNQVSLDVFTAADLKDACFILVRFEHNFVGNVDEMMESILQAYSPPDGRDIYLIPVFGEMTLEMVSEEIMEQAGWQRKSLTSTKP